MVWGSVVGMTNKQIVGYLSLHSRISFQDDNEAEFEICVHPDYEGEGRGSDLVKWAIQHVEEKTNLCCLKALVEKGNSKSEGMLKDKLGFRILKTDNLGSVLIKDIKC